MLSTPLCLGLTSCSFPLAFLSITSFYMTPHVILLYFIILIILGEHYKSRSSWLCSTLHPPVTSSIFGLNNLISTLFLYALGPCFSLNARDQISYQYRTTDKIIALYILIYNISTADKKTEGFGLNVATITRTLLYIAN
jgi:hypothetical protein